MPDFNLYLGNSLDVLRDLPAESVDSIVTDPPYGLTQNKKGGTGAKSVNLNNPAGRSRISTGNGAGGFMGKKWDSDVPSTEIWAECLRVLKPGGNLLCFAGTRTQHRMVARVVEVGFELQDIVLWTYGCLSEDSEILTKDGWVQYRRAMNSEVLSYDVERDIYKWERPQRWYVYSVESDTAFRIRSDKTDQVVSRGHRCLVEREGKLLFVRAEELSGMEVMPTLQSDFFDIQVSKEGELQQEVQWALQGARLGQTRSQRQVGLDRGELGILSRENDWAWKSSMERGIDLLQKEREICGSVNKICAMPGGVCGDGTERWLRDGAQTDSGPGNWEAPAEGRMHTSHQSRCDGQQIGKLDAIRIQCGSQEVRTRASYRTTLATITPVEYSGVFWCPSVSTGAFVARRNGKVFITGNSGFPKSHNIEKAVQKIAPEEASRFQGNGTSLKPAHEIISIYIKPPGEPQFHGEFKRLYYCAKASKRERNLGLVDRVSTHPTIKPLKLMKQLCELATPKGGTILDPFMGSGTTGLAALSSGFDFIGIDITPEYFEIASLRLNSLYPQSK